MGTTVSLSQVSAAEVADILKREKIISEKGISLILENEIDGEALLAPVKRDEALQRNWNTRTVGDKVKFRDFISKHRTKSVTPAAQTDALDPHSEQSVSNLEPD